MTSAWGVTPRASVSAECRNCGLEAVVARCLGILRGDAVDDGFLLVIGGPAARSLLDGGHDPATSYWPKTWALRALLYAWSDRAAVAVVNATADDSWRIREMAAKVIARHRIDEGLEAVIRLGEDPVERVRAAAARAKRRLTSAPTEQHRTG